MTAVAGFTRRAVVQILARTKAFVTFRYHHYRVFYGNPFVAGEIVPRQPEVVAPVEIRMQTMREPPVNKE